MTFRPDNQVIIVGGGVIGLSIARELRRAGVKHITVVDKGRCGEEASWAAGGMLSPQAEASEGGPFFDICAESRSIYPRFAEELLAETGIDPELDQAGTLFAAFSENDFREIVAKHEWQRDSPLRIETLSAEEVRREEPFISPDVYGALYFSTLR